MRLVRSIQRRRSTVYSSVASLYSLISLQTPRTPRSTTPTKERSDDVETDGLLGKRRGSARVPRPRGRGQTRPGLTASDVSQEGATGLTPLTQDREIRFKAREWAHFSLYRTIRVTELCGRLGSPEIREARSRIVDRCRWELKFSLSVSIRRRRYPRSQKRKCCANNSLWFSVRTYVKPH